MGKRRRQRRPIPTTTSTNGPPPGFRGEEKKDSDDGVVKFEDMLKANQHLGVADLQEPSFVQDRCRLDVMDPNKQYQRRKA
jgi:hypothetical protein